MDKLHQQNKQSSGRVKRPFFTLIITTYKDEQYIEKCLESVAKQGLSQRDLEVIIMNDCSQDKTVENINKFLETGKQKLNAKVIVNKKNVGVSESRNTALDNATGKFIAFLDGDDTLHEKSMKNIKSLIETTGADLVVPQMEMVHYNKTPDPYTMKKRPLNEKLLNSLENPDDFFVALDDKNVRLTSIASAIVSKDIIDKNGFRFEKTLDEDTKWSANLYAHAKHPKVYAGKYYYYHRRGDSRSLKDMSGIAEAKLQWVKDFLKMRETYPKLQGTYACLAQRQFDFVSDYAKALTDAKVKNAFDKKLKKLSFNTSSASLLGSFFQKTTAATSTQTSSR